MDRIPAGGPAFALARVRWGQSCRICIGGTHSDLIESRQSPAEPEAWPLSIEALSPMIETRVVRAADRSVVVRDDAGHEFTFLCPSKRSSDVKAGQVAMTLDTPEAHDVTVEQFRAARETAILHAQSMGWLSKG